jgi:hypothetical protein
MGEKESLIRARYTVSVLRVARGSPINDAAKLVAGLSRDWLDMEADEKIAEARISCLRACEKLAETLRANLPSAPQEWDRAERAAALWLKTLE